MTDQQAEHEAFELNGFDRFEGFDRGDIGRSDDELRDQGSRVIGRMTSEAGYRVEIVEDYSDDLSLFSVFINGACVTELFDERARAIRVARWWMDGCPA